MSIPPIEVFELRRLLTVTGLHPSALLDRMMRHHTDPAAVQALCEHAEKSFPLLSAQCQDTADTDLQAVLCTAQTMFSDEDPLLFAWFSYWFIMSVPLEAITDKVVAEMSVWAAPDVCPPLGAAGSPQNHKDLHHAGYWLMSRCLYNRFGKHSESWHVFMKMYDPSKKIGDVADQVASLHTRFGKHSESWDVFKMLYDPSKKIGDVADQVASLHTRFGKHSESWDVFKMLYDPSKAFGDVADQVAYLYNRFGEHDLSWDMFIHLYEPPAPIDGPANTVAYLYTRFGTHRPWWEMFKNVYDPPQTVCATADLVVAVEPRNS